MLQRIGVSSTSVSLSNSLYGDQSEDEGMIGKKEQSYFSSKGGGVVLMGHSDGCLLSPSRLLSG